MNYYLGLPLFLAVALLQVAAMPSFSPLGVTPNILLVFTACWVTVRGQPQAMILVPMAALFRDLLTAEAVGTSVIALAPLLLLAGIAGGRPTEARLMPTLLVVAAGTLAYHLLNGIITIALGQTVPWATALTQVWLPAVAVNAVLTPAFYLPLWWAPLGERPRRGPTGR
ncbi:MAG: rod shape-determining protein MreD [Dehalococcoidia bacterium]